MLAVHPVNFQDMPYFCEFTVNYKSISALLIVDFKLQVFCKRNIMEFFLIRI